MDFDEASRQVAAIRARLADIPDPTALLERLFAFAPVAFQIFRADGRALVSNQAFVDLFGSAPPPDYCLFRDEVLAERGILDHVRRAFSGETVDVPPVWYDARDVRHVTVTEGRRVAVGGTMFPLHDRDGGVSFVAVVIHDITRELERQAEGEAEAERVAFIGRASAVLSSSLDYAATLRAVARAAVPGFADWCIIDLLGEDGRLERVDVAYADPAWAEVAARVRVQPATGSGTGRHPQTRVLAERRPVLIAALTAEEALAIAHDSEHAAAILATGVRSAIAVPLAVQERVLGTIVLGRCDVARAFGAADLVLAAELAGRAALAIDHARLYAEAQRTNASLAEASRAKDDFLAMLGHELRNPLSPMVTALDLMRMRGDDAFARERAMIERQVQHLIRLVDDLLDVSRIARGAIVLRRRRVEVGEVVARAVEMASPLLEQRRHHLDVDVPPRGLRVDADESRLAQVLTNLLINAARYTNTGGRIALAARRGDDGLVEIAVRDSGRGIAPELLPHVFDLFVQGGRPLDRADGGLGLGLAIARNLVQLHGGTIAASSDGVGRGSEFVVRLPAAAAPAQRRVAPAAASPARVRPRRVLVVDDNADVAQSIAAWLTARGHDVVVAGDGPGALRAAAVLRPHVALIDIGLPVMDGYELARRLRAAPDGNGCALVAVTGYGQDGDRERSAQAGFAAHLVKPVPPERVGAVVDELGARDEG